MQFHHLLIKGKIGKMWYGVVTATYLKEH